MFNTEIYAFLYMCSVMFYNKESLGLYIAFTDVTLTEAQCALCEI